MGYDKSFIFQSNANKRPNQRFDMNSQDDGPSPCKLIDISEVKEDIELESPAFIKIANNHLE